MTRGNGTTGALFVGIGVLWLAACSSSGSGSGSNELQANPCATKGATYLETFAEQAGGTCGALSNEILNINPDGTITSSISIACASTTQEGCTAHDSDCTYSASGYAYTVTTDVTFASDGSSASGLETVTGTGNGESCTSTYDVTMTRQ